jgi:hypothetical protein
MYAVDTLMSFVMDSAIYMATTVGALLLLLVLVRVTASLQRRALLFVLQPFPKVSQNCHCLSILQVFVLSLSFSVAAADYSTHSSAVAHVNSTATISTWTALTSAITASAGTTATLTLEANFDMAGFTRGSQITLSAANTDITLVGNGAVFDGGQRARFFAVGSGGAENIKLVMSNVVMKNVSARCPHLLSPPLHTLGSFCYSFSTPSSTPTAPPPLHPPLPHLHPFIHPHRTPNPPSAPCKSHPLPIMHRARYAVPSWPSCIVHAMLCPRGLHASYTH